MKTTVKGWVTPEGGLGRAYKVDLEIETDGPTLGDLFERYLTRDGVIAGGGMSDKEIEQRFRAVQKRRRKAAMDAIMDRRRGVYVQGLGLVDETPKPDKPRFRECICRKPWCAKCNPARAGVEVNTFYGRTFHKGRIDSILACSAPGDRYGICYTDASGVYSEREVAFSRYEVRRGRPMFLGVSEDGPRWFYVCRIDSLTPLGREEE